MSHGIRMCSCGAVINRCRCIDHATAVHVVQNGCGRCKSSAPNRGVLVATRRPHQTEVVQYTAETKEVVKEWVEGAGNYIEDRPEPGDWVIKVTYPWGTGYEAEIYADETFRYWFDLPA